MSHFNPTPLEALADDAADLAGWELRVYLRAEIAWRRLVAPSVARLRDPGRRRTRIWL